MKNNDDLELCTVRIVVPKDAIITCNKGFYVSTSTLGVKKKCKKIDVWGNDITCIRDDYPKELTVEEQEALNVLKIKYNNRNKTKK